MIELRKTDEYNAWLRDLRDVLGRGGDKATQQADIDTALRLAQNL